MLSARTHSRQAAAPLRRQGRGCLSPSILSPLLVFLIGVGVTALAFNADASSPAVPADASGRFVLSTVFTPEVQFWSASIVRWAAAAGLDADLVATVMQIESCGDPLARSGAGAMGLFQVMPYHFGAYEDPFSPETNASRGLDYLRRSLQAANDDAREAFAGYNGGISLIRSPERTWPAETSRYAYWATGIYSDALTGASASDRLDEWLTSGGAALCSRAAQNLYR
jgi:soluble lytic murein transglycosylase-like protein